LHRAAQFDLEQHNQRKGLGADGKKVEKQAKVICPCGCGKMIAPELYSKWPTLRIASPVIILTQQECRTFAETRV
jgi:hypothetical protein